MSKLDYRALIYASIAHTPWREADLARIETYMRQCHGVLGHMSVEEFRTEAVVAAQAQLERPSLCAVPKAPAPLARITVREPEFWIPNVRPRNS